MIALTTTAVPAVAAQVNPNTIPATYTALSCGSTGWSVEVPHRTSGFNPLTATSDQLIANDLPPAPPTSDTADYNTWKNFVTHPINDTTSCGQYSSPNGSGTSQEPRTPSGQVAGTANGTPSNSANEMVNWAGNVSHNQLWTQATGEWVVQKTTGSSSARASQWVGVGLGSSANYPLYQAGTAASGGGSPVLWTEVYPEQNQVNVPNMSVRVGDLVGIHVSILPTGAGFNVYNMTQNTSRTIFFVGVHTPDGHAEWIDERPSLGCNPSTKQCIRTPYAQQNVSFMNARAYSVATNWQTVAKTSHYYFNMFDCQTGAQLASTGWIGSDGMSYSVNWSNYGNLEWC